MLFEKFMPNENEDAFGRGLRKKSPLGIACTLSVPPQPHFTAARISPSKASTVAALA